MPDREPRDHVADVPQRQTALVVALPLVRLSSPGGRRADFASQLCEHIGQIEKLEAALALTINEHGAGP